MKKTKFVWQYIYVPEGQLQPDGYGRWAIDCYIFVHIDKALPKYEWTKEYFEDVHMPVKVATIFQKGTLNGHVPSLVHKYGTCIPTFDDAVNMGLSMSYFYSNDIEELKSIVEEKYNQTRNVFENTK
jgi:hypothetical protein